MKRCASSYDTLSSPLWLSESNPAESETGRSYGTAADRAERNFCLACCDLFGEASSLSARTAISLLYREGTKARHPAVHLGHKTRSAP